MQIERNEFKGFLFGCALAAGLISGAAAQTIGWYDVSSGDALSGTGYTGTLSGGAFAGDTFAQVFSLSSVKAQTSNNDLLGILSSNGVTEYIDTTGAFHASLNPTLSGGIYGGETLGQAYAAGQDVDLSNLLANQAQIFGATGLSIYSTSTGNLTSTFDPTLSGGSFNGRTLGQVFSGGGVTLSLIQATSNNLAILGSGGVSYYTMSNGAFGGTFNPTFTGGVDNGLTLGQAYSEGLVIGATQVNNTEELSLISPLPEPPSWVLVSVGGAMLIGMCWFRLRPGCAN
jgi:hypothetical protein